MYYRIGGSIHSVFFSFSQGEKPGLPVKKRSDGGRRKINSEKRPVLL